MCGWGCYSVIPILSFKKYINIDQNRGRGRAPGGGGGGGGVIWRPMSHIPTLLSNSQMHTDALAECGFRVCTSFVMK